MEVSGVKASVGEGNGIGKGLFHDAAPRQKGREERIVL